MDIKETFALENEHLRAEVERWKDEHGKACLLVAKMHHAATGAITGPRRGVVEDVEDMKAERDSALAKLEAVRDRVTKNNDEHLWSDVLAILDGDGK